MPRLEDLRRDLLKMGPDELRAKLRDVRADRRISKAPIKAAKEKAKSADKAITNIGNLLAGMTPEQVEAFLAEIGE